MFDVGAGELLVIVIVAIVVIGPKELPMALRTAGRWIGKVRRMSAHFRSCVETMIREAEIQEMEEKWAARNKEIMAKYPDGEPGSAAAPADLLADQLGGEMTPLAPPPSEAEADASAEAAIKRAGPPKKPADADAEPVLPLDPPPAPPKAD